ncbi:MAG: DUF5666 domain-containing protein [Syntrophales bacterium]
MKKISLVLYCVVSLMLAGCGGGAGSPDVSSNSNATESSSSISKGTVAKTVAGTSGQEIMVNNVTYRTDSATVTRNGDDAVNNDLKPGMQVKITGSHDGSNGSATRVEIEGQLEGTVGQIDAINGIFVLLGQKVVVNNQTIFEGIAGIASLASGQRAEVYGLPDSNGTVVATRVESKDSKPQDSSPQTLYISGSISGLDSTGKTFSVGTIAVNYSTATLPVQTLANGLMVSVQGNLVNGVVKATGIRSRDDHVEQGKAELEGLVSEYDVTAGTFTLNSQQVKITSATIYQKGVVNDIANGVKVEVKGSVVNGILTASRVEIDREHGYTAPQPVTPVPPVTPVTPVTPVAPVTPVTPALDGAALYAQNCTGCHGSGKRGKSAAATQSAINSNRGGMGSLSSLTPEEIAAIAAW